MHGAYRLLSLILLAAAAAVFAQNNVDNTDKGGTASGPPVAAKDNVVDTVNGHQIADPYRWLEDAKSPETEKWTEGELNYTRSVLDKVPGREQLHARLTELLHIGTLGTPDPNGKYLFYTRREGAQNQPVLFVKEGNGPERVLVDVNPLSPDGTLALDWWHVSHDGKYVAYGTSQSGSEISTLHVVDVATGKLLSDTIERTRAASVAWLPDDSGFYYTRYPKPGDVPAGEEMYNRHVFFHKLGSDPAQDPLVYGKGLDAQAWPQVQLSEDGHWLLLTIEHGWTKTDLLLKDTHSDAAPQMLTGGKDFIYGGDINKDKLYIITNEDAPRFRMFVTDAAHPERANWRELVPQTDAVLKTFVIANGKMLLLYEQNANSQIKLVSLDGKHLADVKLPALGTVDNINGAWDHNDAYFNFQSFAIPITIFRYDVNEQKETQWGQVAAPGVDSKAYDVKQVWYTSKDGTKVPMFIVAKKGTKQTGNTPTLLTGYGGFNISELPSFNKPMLLWLEHGGIFAMANMRGGSEFGEEWHRAGMLDKKQNVFDDFIAAGEYLVAQKYTDRDHLVVYGRSNGGLLTGAVLTQRPDLYKAVVCGVPLLDMVRYQNFQIAKLWIPEYGSAEDPKQFDFIYAYSPYHHVKAGQEYPATLFFASDTDTRVDPMHAKKMTALMQAEAKNGRDPNRPILLRIDMKAGHGAGKPVSKQVDEWTDIWAFVFWQVGVKP